MCIVVFIVVFIIVCYVLVVFVSFCKVYVCIEGVEYVKIMYIFMVMFIFFILVLYLLVYICCMREVMDVIKKFFNIKWKLYILIIKFINDRECIKLFNLYRYIVKKLRIMLIIINFVVFDSGFNVMVVLYWKIILNKVGNEMIYIILVCCFLLGRCYYESNS